MHNANIDGEEVRKIDAEKHIREKERLNQALNENLPNVQTDLEDVFKKYGIDAMPSLAHDVSCFVIEELYLKRFNLPKY